MKLLRVHIITADSSAKLLEGCDLWLRNPIFARKDYGKFDPLCLVGPNGAGKSQFLQALTDMFQSAIHACMSNVESIEGNPDLQFEVEYLIRPERGADPIHVRIVREAEGRRRPTVKIQTKDEFEWMDRSLADPVTWMLLPEKIVGYTSGDNETLSLPYLISRSGYADEVGRRALYASAPHESAPDRRLMLIDYGTNLEVLVSNLLMGSELQRAALLENAQLRDIHSFRCVIRFAHTAAPKALNPRKVGSTRKKIQLTSELEEYLDNLKRCATCYHVDAKTETYTFDFWINKASKTAFQSFWENALNLYTTFHKFAMLNDLVISRDARERFKRQIRERHFASRLPEPQDEEKVFLFERVQFVAGNRKDVIDYVALSDGEHQLGQVLGIFGMLSFPNVVFLLDEPESHFNPQWRVKFTSRIRELPTPNGDRAGDAQASEQECIITTHSPFVPSDLRRDKVFIFSKNEQGKVIVRHPEVETYGTTFDTIVEECFGVRPPISQVALDDIEELMDSKDPKVVERGIQRLGHSVEKVLLADHLRQLTDGNGE